MSDIIAPFKTSFQTEIIIRGCEKKSLSYSCRTVRFMAVIIIGQLVGKGASKGFEFSVIPGRGKDWLTKNSEILTLVSLSIGLEDKWKYMLGPFLKWIFVKWVSGNFCNFEIMSSCHTSNNYCPLDMKTH